MLLLKAHLHRGEDLPLPVPLLTSNHWEATPADQGNASGPSEATEEEAAALWEDWNPANTHPDWQVPEDATWPPAAPAWDTTSPENQWAPIRQPRWSWAGYNDIKRDIHQ